MEDKSIICIPRSISTVISFNTPVDGEFPYLPPPCFSDMLALEKYLYLLWW